MRFALALGLGYTLLAQFAHSVACSVFAASSSGKAKIDRGVIAD